VQLEHPPTETEELAYALLAASCSEEVTTEHVYLALITPPDDPDEHRVSASSWVPVYGTYRAPAESIDLAFNGAARPARRLCVEPNVQMITETAAPPSQNRKPSRPK
jgi:hypothetical protein